MSSKKHKKKFLREIDVPEDSLQERYMTDTEITDKQMIGRQKDKQTSSTQAALFLFCIFYFRTGFSFWE